MTEMHCATCGKVLGYLAAGSKIANGTVHFCYKCKAKSDVPNFLKGLFK
jgi:hypothetical protein